MSPAIALLAVMAQTSDFAAFVMRTNEATPPPTIPEVRRAVLAGLREDDRQRPACTTAEITPEPVRTAIATRAIVAGVRDGELRNGWTVYVQVRGCPGVSRVRMLLLRFVADNSLHAFPLHQGESLANTSLLSDVRVPAAVAATSVARLNGFRCDEQYAYFVSARVLTRGSDLSEEWHGAYFAGTWEEAWTFSFCNRLVEVPIAFTADGQSGAHFAIRATDARLLP